MIKIVLIPKERIGALIGEKGATKRTIERATSTKLTVSDEEAEINGESLDILTAENIIKAIGRGFSPENALLLMKEENTLDIVQLPKNNLEKQRSRIIGAKGKSRYTMENLTMTKISVYGKTVSIIGGYENVHVAREAIEKLINGFTHKSVYAFLESKQSSLRSDQI